MERESGNDGAWRSNPIGLESSLEFNFEPDPVSFSFGSGELFELLLLLIPISTSDEFVDCNNDELFIFFSLFLKLDFRFEWRLRFFDGGVGPDKLFCGGINEEEPLTPPPPVAEEAAEEEDFDEFVRLILFGSIRNFGKNNEIVKITVITLHIDKIIGSNKFIEEEEFLDNWINKNNVIALE